MVLYHTSCALKDGIVHFPLPLCIALGNLNQKKKQGYWITNLNEIPNMKDYCIKDDDPQP